jgi:hypothetical protein
LLGSILQNYGIKEEEKEEEEEEKKERLTLLESCNHAIVHHNWFKPGAIRVQT